MNQLDEREKMRAAGLDGESISWVFCQPAPTELVVCWVDRNNQTLGAGADPYEGATHAGPWSEFEPRYAGPFDTASYVGVGDFVTPRAGSTLIVELGPDERGAPWTR